MSKVKRKLDSKETKDKIIELFYNEHLRQTDISKKLKVKMPYITRIIQTDSRYIEEKEARKQESKEKVIMGIYNDAIAEIKRHQKYNELDSIREEKDDLISLIQNSTTLNKYWKDLFFRVLELQKKELEFKI